MSRRKPSERCAVCDKTIEETGGVRLVATGFLGLHICTPNVSLGNLKHPTRTIRLRGDYRDVIVVFSGQHLWEDGIVKRVECTVYKGKRPWFCQRCSHNSLCPNCESPLTTTPGADRLEDNGKTIHSAYFAGFIRQCSNSKCEAHGKDIRESEVTHWIEDIPFDPDMMRRVDEMFEEDTDD